jgi:hypothetical protein
MTDDNSTENRDLAETFDGVVVPEATLWGVKTRSRP